MTERQELPPDIRRMRDEPYLAWVRTLPCRVAGMGHACQGDVVAHHRAGGGVGTKVGDRQTIPLCDGHHRARHALTGPFKGWARERIREWERSEVLRTMELRMGFDVF